MSINKCGINEIIRKVRYFREDPMKKKFRDFRRLTDKVIWSRRAHTQE